MSGFSVFSLKIDTLPTKKVYQVVQVFLSIIKVEAHRLVKSESKMLAKKVSCDTRYVHQGELDIFAKANSI